MKGKVVSALVRQILDNTSKQSPILVTALLICLSAMFAYSAKAMTLEEAERLALKNDPLSKKMQAMQDSFSEQAVAANSWPDPKLRIGIANLNMDNYKLEQEPMTQQIIGVTQMFPPWGAVGAKSGQMQHMATAMEHETRNRRLMTLMGVRNSWLDVYQYDQSLSLIRKSLKIFKELVNVTQYQYRAGRGNQQDIIRAQLEESLLQDKLTALEASYEGSVAILTKWLGVSRLDNLDMEFPALPKLPSDNEIVSNIERHPTVLARNFRVNAAENGVNYAKAQRRPGWSISLQYGIREPESRDDLGSAILSFDLPFFKRNRQDRLVSARQSDVIVAQQELDDWHRELAARLAKTIAVYNRAVDRVQLYKKSVLPQAEQNTEATRNAYQSGVTDFNVLVRARLTELNSQLQYIQLNVQRAKAQVELLYLAGVN